MPDGPHERGRVWQGLHCNIFQDEVFGVVWGYIDESYDGKRLPDIFTLSCSLAHGGEWAFFEAAWLWVIGKKNRSLLAQNRKLISRYHAVDCHNRKKDFKGWEREERNSFVAELFEVFAMFPTVHVSLTISAKDIAEIWPENKDQPLHFAYYILLQILMLEIGRNQGTLGIGGKIALVYERSDYGEALLRGFNKLMADPTFNYPKAYTTLAPMGWENCVPLQPADMVAYELFRDAKRRAAGGSMYRSLAALGELPTFKLLSKKVDRQSMIKLRKMHEAALLRGLAK